jgi:hypothetical protein
MCYQQSARTGVTYSEFHTETVCPASIDHHNESDNCLQIQTNSWNNV